MIYPEGMKGLVGPRRIGTKNFDSEYTPQTTPSSTALPCYLQKIHSHFCLRNSSKSGCYAMWHWKNLVRLANVQLTLAAHETVYEDNRPWKRRMSGFKRMWHHGRKNDSFSIVSSEFWRGSLIQIVLRSSLGTKPQNSVVWSNRFRRAL